jgi:hypothetical protein
VATIRGTLGVPGPTLTRADAHQTHTESMPTTRKHSTPTRLHVSSIAGRKTGMAPQYPISVPKNLPEVSKNATHLSLGSKCTSSCNRLWRYFKSTLSLTPLGRVFTSRQCSARNGSGEVDERQRSQTAFRRSGTIREQPGEETIPNDPKRS